MPGIEPWVLVGSCLRVFQRTCSVLPSHQQTGGVPAPPLTTSTWNCQILWWLDSAFPLWPVWRLPPRCLTLCGTTPVGSICLQIGKCVHTQDTGHSSARRSASIFSQSYLFLILLTETFTEQKHFNMSLFSFFLCSRVGCLRTFCPFSLFPLPPCLGSQTFLRYFLLKCL